MFPDFLPASVKELSDPASIRLMQQIQRCPIETPLSSLPIPSAFVQQGSKGTPIVLLHGFDSSLLEFRFVLPLLAQQTETWLIDLLGFGFTERPRAVPCTPAAIKTHLHCFWQTQIKQPMTLVGASMGGAAAIDFALTYPEAVSKLVLIDSVGYTGAPPFVKFLFPPFDYWAVEYLRQRKLKALELSQITGANLALQDLIRCSMLHAEMSGWHESMISFTKSGGYSFLADQIKLITRPTLILWGEFDDVLGTADATRFHQDITNSKLIWIRNCKHVPHIEQPEITTQYLLN